MTFTIIGLVLGFAAVFGMVWLADRIAYMRGLGGAHPLSLGMALAVLAGTIIMLILFLGGVVLDREADTTRIRSALVSGGDQP